MRGRLKRNISRNFPADITLSTIVFIFKFRVVIYYIKQQLTNLVNSVVNTRARERIFCRGAE